ncbi:MAG: peptidoglycan bridge formation glycyltransferase FemA/FemB family protein [Cellulomonadaceae bacterium]|jgi:lipid II:glycine glycyltransferase (peptidoglycan interpeptide bridge formation enzyme)|nr:peptidoglycan bridge formation glycyltransferase FemA/FemB family protein [Cellulomonadaceae bacterium]
MFDVTEVHDPSTWDKAVTTHGGHPLQLWAWGEVKAEGPWTARRIAITEAAAPRGFAQVLVRRLPAPFTALCYVPRGPVLACDDGEAAAAIPGVAEAVVGWCRSTVGGIAVSFEPAWDASMRFDVPRAVKARNTILYPSTLILDLTRDSDALLADMRKSTRYEIRRAARDGLDIRRATTADEFASVMAVYRETSSRAGFALHDDAYYRAIHEKFGEASRILVARDTDGNICSFAWSVVTPDTAFLLYGGGNEASRALKATAPVYWAAMTDAKELGAKNYDLNGLLNDGISEFKRSFGKHDNELVGTWDVPLNTLLYQVWERALPAAKKVVQRIRR